MEEGLRTAGSLSVLKRGLRSGFLGGYAAFRCSVPACYVCLGGWGAEVLVWLRLNDCRSVVLVVAGVFQSI